MAVRTIDTAPTTRTSVVASGEQFSSRRALLASAVGGLSGLVMAALGRPASVQAAAGGPMILGQANDSGTSQTTLANAGLGAAFTLKTTNASTGATGIFGWTSQTGANATRGVYGKADGPNSNAVVARQTGPAGAGAAVYAEGANNYGVYATGTSKAAVRAVATTGNAIVGSTDSGVGVIGGSTDGSGVSGQSENWIGVGGSSTNLFGVWGESTNNYAGFFVNHVYMGSFVDVVQIPEPAAPADDQARLFVRDIGEGHSQLCVLFPTGAIQVIATEPA
jgi:hypothetical protein